MRAYVFRRLLLMIPTVFVVALFVFSVSRVIPGSVVDLMVSEMADAAQGWGVEITEESISHELGLDQPLYSQFGEWLGNALQGNLGLSLWSRRPVTEEILRRLPVSLELALMSIIFGVLVAIPLGVLSAVRQDTTIDYLGRTFAIVCMAIPAFWLATLVWLYPAIWWDWTPPIEYVRFTVDPLASLRHLVAPALIASMLSIGVVMRMTRTMMLEVLRQDYIRTAWSKGLREWTVIARHALKNAMIPVITIVGLRIPVVIGGLLIIEQIFCVPGIARYLILAITQRDYPVISGINLVMAMLILFVNLAVDLVYAWLDPRIRYK